MRLIKSSRAACNTWERPNALFPQIIGYQHWVEQSGAISTIFSSFVVWSVAGPAIVVSVVDNSMLSSWANVPPPGMHQSLLHWGLAWGCNIAVIDDDSVDSQTCPLSTARMSSLSPWRLFGDILLVPWFFLLPQECVCLRVQDSLDILTNHLDLIQIADFLDLDWNILMKDWKHLLILYILEPLKLHRNYASNQGISRSWASFCNLCW